MSYLPLGYYPILPCFPEINTLKKNQKNFSPKEARYKLVLYVKGKVKLDYGDRSQNSGYLWQQVMWGPC